MINIKTILLLSFVFGGLAVAVGADAQGEIQQQLEGVSSTLDTVGAQLESVREKGIIQTVWGNIIAPFLAVWQQLAGIFAQIGALLGIVAK